MQTGDVFKDTVLEGIQRTRLHAESNGSDYDVWVALPPSYGASPERRYPMLLVLDAALHFPLAATTATYHALEQTCEEIIVVGISTSGPVSEHHFGRSIDYAPPGMKDDLRESYTTLFKPYFASQGMNEERWEQTKGQLFNGGDAFRSFVDGQLVPWIEAHYRTDPNALGLAGHSLGGAYASYALIKGSAFTRFLIGSYGVMWYGDTLPGLEADFAAAGDERRIAIFESHGQIEEDNAAALAATYGDVFGESSGLLDRLAASRPDTVSVTHEIVPGQGHIGCAPGVFAGGIKALYPKVAAPIPAE
jgi:predicted alpha/beta superfamily hydrolase